MVPTMITESAILSRPFDLMSDCSRNETQPVRDSVTRRGEETGTRHRRRDGPTYVVPLLEDIVAGLVGHVEEEDGSVGVTEEGVVGLSSYGWGRVSRSDRDVAGG